MMDRITKDSQFQNSTAFLDMRLLRWPVRYIITADTGIMEIFTG